MSMLRHYFIGANLDDLESFEEQLEELGVTTPQIHVLSKQDEDVANHQHLNSVQSFMKQDIIHSTELGALIGIIASLSVLCIAYFAGWTETAAGWTPFVFLSVVVLGFCTWEGGFIGIQTLNYHFAKFAGALKRGKHIFFVDLYPEQEGVLKTALKSHPHVKLAGTGTATPRWILALEDKVPRFLHTTFP